MDTKNLVAEAKARFNHNSAKAYLKEKYQSRLIVAEQGGLWSANPDTIGLLYSIKKDKVILVDLFENLVEIHREELLSKLIEVYETVMQEWYAESKELEKKR